MNYFMQPADFVFEGSNSSQLESYGFRLVCTELHGKKLKGKKIKTKVIMCFKCLKTEDFTITIIFCEGTLLVAVGEWLHHPGPFLVAF